MKRPIKNPIKKNIKSKNSIHITNKNENVVIEIKWPKGESVIMGEILAALITGKLSLHLLGNAEQYAKSIGDEKGFEIISQIVMLRVQEQKDAIDNDKSRKPLVHPLNAIRHQITMFQGNE